MKRDINYMEHKIMRILSTVLFALSAVSALYFVIIVLYSGLGTSYCSVWIFFTAAFAVMGHFAKAGLTHGGGMPRLLPNFIFTSFVLFLVIFTGIMTAVVKDAKPAKEYPRTDYAIVLGARVYKNGVSKTLMYRLERGLQYYQEHPDTTLVLTGGQDNGDVIPEALAMFNYFSMHGVPSSKMIIDTGGTSTVEIITRAVDRIEYDTAEKKVPKGPGDIVWAIDHVPSVGIITSDYHMMRALRVTETLGIKSPVAIPAQSDKILFLHQCVRESAAIVKDYLMGNFTLNEREIPFNRAKRGR